MVNKHPDPDVELPISNEESIFDVLLDDELVNFADATATGPALVIVILAWIAVGLGDLDDGGLDALAKIPAWIVLGLASWIVGTHLTFLIGTKVLKTPRRWLRMALLGLRLKALWYRTAFIFWSETPPARSKLRVA